MKPLFFSVLFLLTCALTAQGTKSDKAFTSEIKVNHSVEDTWRLLSDVTQWKKWDSHIIDARLVGDLVADAQGTLVTSNSKVVNFRVIDFKQGESYTVRHKLSSGVFYVKRSVIPSDKGAKILTMVWYKGLSLKNFEKYMGGDYNLILQNELKRFQELLFD
jgi:hypothetical protein